MVSSYKVKVDLSSPPKTAGLVRGPVLWPLPAPLPPCPNSTALLSFPPHHISANSPPLISPLHHHLIPSHSAVVGRCQSRSPNIRLSLLRLPSCPVLRRTIEAITCPQYPPFPCFILHIAAPPPCTLCVHINSTLTPPLHLP